jgi:hypothetical protein
MFMAFSGGDEFSVAEDTKILVWAHPSYALFWARAQADFGSAHLLC